MTRGNERIKLSDTVMDCASKMSEGNPGGLSVCMQMISTGAKIDPDAFGGGVAGLLAMDSLGIYGSRIWMLYKDVCGENLTKTMAMLRAWQLGFLTRSALDHAIDNYGNGVDVDALLSQVKDRLPNFAQA